MSTENNATARKLRSHIHRVLAMGLQSYVTFEHNDRFYRGTMNDEPFKFDDGHLVIVEYFLVSKKHIDAICCRHLLSLEIGSNVEPSGSGRLHANLVGKTLNPLTDNQRKYLVNRL